MALLTSSREVASDTTEATSAVRRAEAAGDFLLEFDHPQITFRAVVIERHTGIRQKAQDFIAAALQPLD